MAAPGFDFVAESPLERCCAEFWAAQGEALSSEPQFREVMNRLLESARGKVVAGNLTGAKRDYDYFRWADIHCCREPMASTFDYGTCLFLSLAADAALAEGDYYESLAQVEHISAVLQEGDERRRWLGEKPRHNTEVRIQALRLLAELKWLRGLHDPQIRDRLSTPEQMLADLQQYQLRVRQRTQMDPSSPESAHLVENVGWCGLSVLKVALRWLGQEELVPAIAAFNRVHGTMLTLEHGSTAKGGGVEDIWMWEWELAKAYCSGRLSPDMLDEIQWNCVSLAAGCKMDLACYLRGLQREATLYQTKTRKQFSVVGSRV